MGLVRIIKKFWAWVSHGDTVWGIFNMIFPTVGGIGGWLVTWFTSLHPALVYFSILIGIALGLFISNEISARRIQKRLKKTQIPKEETLEAEIENLQARKTEPKQHEFYPHRPDMETLKKFIREHEIVYAFFPMGDSLKINHFYELEEYKSKLRRVVLMDTEGKHIETLPEKYFINDSVSLIEGVNQVVEAIKKTDIELKLWDGCFPYSMFIGNPLSKVKNGSILLEVIPPFTVGNDRPAILFKQKDYPELFEKLQNTYDEIWGKSRWG